MTDSSMSVALNLIRAHADRARIGGRAPELLIQQAEKALDVVFPPSYRLFLAELGCLALYGLELYGIVPYQSLDAAGVPNAIWLTLEEQMHNKLFSKSIIVSDAGFGPYDVIDCRNPDATGECPVVQWEQGCPTSFKFEVLAPSFGKYCLDQLLVRLQRQR